MIISIFYNQESWHELIRGFIQPFVEGRKDLLRHWSISLSTYRGDNISMYLDIKTSDNNNLKEELLQTVNLFLAEHPSALKVVRYPTDTLFRDYTNNTVEINADELPVSAFGKMNLFAARQGLSEILIDVLADQLIDMESVFTFVVYLQFGIIRASYPNIRQARTDTVKLLLHLNTQDHVFGDSAPHADADNKQFIQLFEYNKDTFAEIIEDIWNRESKDILLQWMDKWDSICKDSVESMEFKDAFVLLSRLAYEQLGLSSGLIQNTASKQILKIFNQVSKSMGNVIRIA